MKHEPLTPPYTDIDSGTGSPSSCTDGEEEMTSHSNNNMTGTSGMVDSSRVFMCMFMFAVLCFNPFRYVLCQRNFEKAACLIPLQYVLRVECNVSN